MKVSSRPSGRRRRRWPLALTVAATLAVAAAPLLPWASSGRKVRSGFDLARVARSLGLGSSWPTRGLLLAVALLPLLAAVAWTAAWLGRAPLVLAAGAASGVVALAGAVVVWRAPVTPEFGPVVGLAAGSLALIGALALALEREPRWTTASSTR